MDESKIAPCGMNCGLCISKQSKKYNLNNKGFKKTYCSGCLSSGIKCNLKHYCDRLDRGLLRYCYECNQYPCSKLKALDKRYRTKYHMSMLENLEFIKAHGIQEFLKKEQDKWQCPKCGRLICCHNGLCLSCNLDRLLQNKKYSWAEE